MQSIICKILLFFKVSYIKGCEAVPTKDVFASLAHHLRAASVPLYRDGAHGAPLDVLRLGPRHPHGDVPHQPRLGAQHSGAALTHESRAILCAGEARVPGAGAEGTELLDAGGAGDGHPLGLVTGADVADGVTTRLGTPRPVSVQRHLCKYHSVTIICTICHYVWARPADIYLFAMPNNLPVFSLKVLCFSIN